MDTTLAQWLIVFAFGAMFFAFAPWSLTKESFFQAKSKKHGEPGLIILISSLVISWIFAKSITNAANLGLIFGFVGGFGYAVYYGSFLVAGIIIYRMRTLGGYNSIHDFLSSKFGGTAVLLFSVLIAFRLFNEVWSNTMVIGSYFGTQGTMPYYASSIAFTLVTLLYTLKGGLRSSLLTDAIQMLFFLVLTALLLFLIFPDNDGGITGFVSSGTWSMSTGVNFVLLAFIQIFSYPFHDPVLTDRGFIASPKTTLKAFLWAGPIGFICILLFSFVGVYAMQKGYSGQAIVEVGSRLGFIAILVVNCIMITSAASTLDSAFSSFSKLVVIDSKKGIEKPVRTGRLMMIIIAIAGTVPIFAAPEILSATTISGTMVLGLAPVFVCWRLNVPKISYFLSIVIGIIVGLIAATDQIPTQLVFSTGKYASLLWANIWGTILCFSGFLLPYLFRPKKSMYAQ